MSEHSPQRLLAGLGVLLAVDFLWVASSELTEYIFKNQKYDKPFFSTYLKTSLFMLYLPGFLLYKPWRDQCLLSRSTNFPRRYHLVAGEDEGEDNPTSNDDEDEEHAQGMSRSLSNPIFQPINYPDSGKSSETESDIDPSHHPALAASSIEEPPGRKVRFNRVAEVRQMSTQDALYANLSRLSYTASLRAQAALRRAANRLNVKEVAQVSLMFSFLWFMGNYSYQLALSNTEAGIVNVLSSTSCLFTLLLSALFPSNSHDKLTFSKFATVCFSMTGVILVSYADLDIENGIPSGAFWALGGAMFYSAYIVLLRRKCDHEDKLDVPMFFGFVGLFNTVLLWPGFLILQMSHTEVFEIPTAQQWLTLALNGIIGTVLSELLWLWGCFLTSSLIATLSISLTIPLTMFADILIKGVDYGALFYVGSIPMFISFFLVTLLTHYEDWDPLIDLLRWIVKSCRGLCNFSPTNNAYVFDRQERESLISQQSSQDA